MPLRRGEAANGAGRTPAAADVAGPWRASDSARLGGTICCDRPTAGTLAPAGGGAVESASRPEAPAAALVRFACLGLPPSDSSSSSSPSGLVAALRARAASTADAWSAACTRAPYTPSARPADPAREGLADGKATLPSSPPPACSPAASGVNSVDPASRLLESAVLGRFRLACDGSPALRRRWAEFHRFFTEFSDRPCMNCDTSFHRGPCFPTNSPSFASSSWDQASLVTVGSRWLNHRSRHCLPMRPLRCPQHVGQRGRGSMETSNVPRHVSAARQRASEVRQRARLLSSELLWSPRHSTKHSPPLLPRAHTSRVLLPIRALYVPVVCDRQSG